MLKERKPGSWPLPRLSPSAVGVRGGNAPGGCEPLAEISGATLFAENCTLCHGPDGKGGGPLAVAKNMTPPDLTTLAPARMANSRWTMFLTNSGMEAGKKPTATKPCRFGRKSSRMNAATPMRTKPLSNWKNF